MSFTGSCHCGAVAYTCSDPVPTEATTCNCSICRRKGAVLHFTSPENVAFNLDEAALGRYQFHRRIITHSFCLKCGLSAFADVNLPGEAPVVALNLRCADIDLDVVTTHEFDGASL